MCVAIGNNFGNLVGNMEGGGGEHIGNMKQMEQHPKPYLQPLRSVAGF